MKATRPVTRSNSESILYIMLFQQLSKCDLKLFTDKALMISDCKLFYMWAALQEKLFSSSVVVYKSTGCTKTLYWWPLVVGNVSLKVNIDLSIPVNPWIILYNCLGYELRWVFWNLASKGLYIIIDAYVCYYHPQ